MAFLNFLFGTKLGQLLVAALIVLLCWWAFSSHYDGVGYQRCRDEHAKAVAAANVKQAEENEARNATASEVAKDATAATVDVINQADDASAKTKKEIEYVYLDRPATAPVVFDSCAHPLDERVQRKLDEAVNRAND
jgi:hypothetical protein